MPARHNHNRGFTLIELMVAVSLFATVAVIATGAVLVANQINQQSQAIKLVMDNLSFALDSMTLKMKQGGSFYCLSASDAGSTNPPTYPTTLGDSHDCVTGDTAIAFQYEDGTAYIYRINNIAGRGQLEVSSGIVTGMKAFVAMTSADINLDNARSRFYVLNTGASDKEPRVLISLYGTAKVGHSTTDFAIETTASDRR